MKGFSKEAESISLVSLESTDRNHVISAVILRDVSLVVQDQEKHFRTIPKQAFVAPIPWLTQIWSKLAPGPWLSRLRQLQLKLQPQDRCNS